MADIRRFGFEYDIPEMMDDRGYHAKVSVQVPYGLPEADIADFEARIALFVKQLRRHIEKVGQ